MPRCSTRCRAGAGKARVNLQELDVDAASFSAHKVGGFKGVGALTCAPRRFMPTLSAAARKEAGAAARRTWPASSGSRQPCMRRPRCRSGGGSPAGSARQAVRAAGRHRRGGGHVDAAPGSEDFLPNIVHVLVDGLESETLILRFDMQGFGVSGGSACSSHSLEPSHAAFLGIDADCAPAPCASRWGATPTKPMSKPSRSPWRRA
ncbi:MAG: aminotransferase class V-fold PLP-dependent enzyme [Eggerthella lenta]